MAVNHLPPYSPELNPAERLWNVLRRDYFANRVFDSLQKASAQAERDLGWPPIAPHWEQTHIISFRTASKEEREVYHEWLENDYTA